ASERKRRIGRRSASKRVSDQPTFAERKRNFNRRNRNQPTGSAATGSTETASQRKRRLRGGG
mgnify:CR=1